MSDAGVDNGDRSTMLIPRDAFRGVRRFDEFQHGLGIARNLPTDRLDKLADGSPPVSLLHDRCPPERRTMDTARLLSVSLADHLTTTLREWKRRDWGEGGSELAWWCTDAPDAFIGGETVLSSMNVEIVAMIGQAAYDLLLTAVAERAAPPLPHPAIPVSVPPPYRRAR